MAVATGIAFAGRASELAAIRACAEAAAAGAPGVVWIEGEAGAGKTALTDRGVEELPAGFTVVRAEADELAADVPFDLVAQLGVTGADGALPAALELLRDWASRQDAGPLAVVVEDLHWADPASRDALRTAARRLAADAVLLIVTSRPGGPADGWERLAADARRCTRIEVGALAPGDVAELARLAGVALDARAAERLHVHTGGHALHVRTLLAELTPQQLAAEGDLPAPRSLASTTIARLAELPGPARELALAPAVLGRPAPLAVAGAVAGVDGPTEALEALLRTGLVTWRPDGTETVVGFTHPLYRVAVHSDLSPTRRQAVQWASSLESDPAAAERHLETGDARGAEDTLRRAADADEPATSAEARARLGTLLMTQARGPEAIDVATGLLDRDDLTAAQERAAWTALAVGVQHVRGAPAGLARLAERLPQAAADVPAADAALLTTRGTMRFYANRTGAAVDDLGAVLALTRGGGGAPDTVARVHLQLAHLSVNAGAWDDAARHAGLAQALIDDERQVWMRAQVHAVRARLDACRGAFDGALTHLTTARAAAEELGTVEATVTTIIAAATLGRARGDAAAVVVPFRAMVGTDAPRVPMATSLNWWSMVVSALIDTGRVDAARAQLGLLRAAVEERGLSLAAPLASLEAQLLLAGGDTDGAVARFTEAVTLVDPDDHVLDRGEVHHRLGRLLVAQGKRRDGVARLRRARDVLDGAIPFVTRVEADLEAAGIHAPRGAGRSPTDLTERERDVVALVVRGMTNREVAAELYVSDKAVEYHLGNVYGKLGIRSRRELRAALGEA
ncbi:MAG: helix-turn-helix transcriptional regulator [Pseudonocardiaceae bacterium]|nr:MAG: helix-turn-helix transcriptional regulator [Pseudonocardiaceae bacterium]